MRLAAAQLNQVVGDSTGNAQRKSPLRTRRSRAGRVCCLPRNCALSGYPPEDLLLREAFPCHLRACLATLCKPRRARVAPGGGQTAIARRAPLPLCHVLHRGPVLGCLRQHDLPNNDVFDEERYFERQPPLFFAVERRGFGVADLQRLLVPLRALCAQAAGAHASWCRTLAVPLTSSTCGTRWRARTSSRSACRCFAANLVAPGLTGLRRPFVPPRSRWRTARTVPGVTRGPAGGRGRGHAAAALRGRRYTAHAAARRASLLALVLGVRDYVARTATPCDHRPVGGVDSASRWRTRTTRWAREGFAR